MSNYPEHHGKYERTELVKTRFVRTMALKRRDRIMRELHEVDAQLDQLDTKIENLQKADSNV